MKKVQISHYSCIYAKGLWVRVWVPHFLLVIVLKSGVNTYVCDKEGRNFMSAWSHIILNFSHFLSSTLLVHLPFDPFLSSSLLHYFLLFCLVFLVCSHLSSQICISFHVLIYHKQPQSSLPPCCMDHQYSPKDHVINLYHLHFN